MPGSGKTLDRARGHAEKLRDLAPPEKWLRQARGGRCGHMVAHATHSARGSAEIKGAITPRNDTPRFEVVFEFERDNSVVGPGPLGAIVRDVKRGDEWAVLVVSQDDAPAIEIVYGGDGSNPAPPPKTAMDAIYKRLAELWDAGSFERDTLMLSGFEKGIRVPYKPRGQSLSLEMVAVRIRRLLADPHGLAGASDTEREWIKAARKHGILRGDVLTERGIALLERVDEAKAAIRSVLSTASTIQRDELRVRLRAFSEAEVQAALYDLEADGEVRETLIECQRCRVRHPGFELALP
jgi:hypothetical protein